MSVSGAADLIGLDDIVDETDEDRIRILLREIVTAAGGEHDDWDTSDRTMCNERRSAVLITPARIRGNPWRRPVNRRGCQRRSAH